MQQRTKKKMLAILDELRRKARRAGARGERRLFADIRQQIAMLHHVADEGMTQEERTAYDDIFVGMEQALDALPPAPESGVMQETAELLGGLVQYLMEKVQAARTKKLFVFLPYKAAMWDSLESIWMAADRDREHCKAMVIPIPYADRNPDGTAKCWHYELDQFPKYVPVVHHETVDLAELHPDAIFIHNPYDNYNSVTSVDMRYYSDRLRRCTDCLVYVPYYVTSGGMGEFQRTLASYENFDYIVAQSEAGLSYYDETIRQKILPLGSPKLDRVVRICSHPPKPPAAWREKMKGRTVYFYNTSLNGLLDDTERFYKKMRYVFSCFRERDDACLLWRPHPLFWSTLEGMRPDDVARFQALRDEFVAGGYGILDTTPDIETTMALSDVYIGDAGTSVTALFGAAGKPIFLLNNRLDTAPDADDERTAYIRWPGGNVEGDWMVQPDNSVWHRGADGVYHLECRLSDYRSGGYYGSVVERGGNLYAIPSNGLAIPVIQGGRVARTIELRDGDMPYGGRFAGCMADGIDPENQRYVFLRPMRYPDLVRIDTATDEVTYIGGVQPMHATETEEKDWIIGGCAYLDHLLYFASPFSADILVLQDQTLAQQVIPVGGAAGVNVIAYDATDGDFWLLPMKGYEVIRWNPMSGRRRVYDAHIDGITCIYPRREIECEAQPFSQAVFSEKSVLLAPLWGNKFVRMDKESGCAEEWTPPAPFLAEPQTEYFYTWGKGGFTRKLDETRWIYYSEVRRRLYSVDLETGDCEEVPMRFDREEVRREAPGFCHLSEWVQYGCEENALQSLPALLSGTLPGAPFDAEAERAAYAKTAANIGTCGEKIYAFLKDKLSK